MRVRDNCPAPVEKLPLYVIANLVYYRTVTSAQVIWDRLQAHEIKGRLIRVYTCSVVARQGYGEGMRWLAGTI